MANCKKCKTNYGYYEYPGVCGKCYTLAYHQQKNRTPKEKKQQSIINKFKLSTKNKKTSTKKTVYYTYNQWLDLGYQVQIGEHATHWNKNGIATFTQKQVKLQS